MSPLLNALITEYVDKQLWQFVSLDEWLETELEYRTKMIQMRADLETALLARHPIKG